VEAGKLRRERLLAVGCARRSRRCRWSEHEMGRGRRFTRLNLAHRRRGRGGLAGGLGARREDDGANRRRANPGRPAQPRPLRGERAARRPRRARPRPTPRTRCRRARRRARGERPRRSCRGAPRRAPGRRARECTWQRAAISAESRPPGWSPNRGEDAAAPPAWAEGACDSGLARGPYAGTSAFAAAPAVRGSATRSGLGSARGGSLGRRSSTSRPRPMPPCSSQACSPARTARPMA
jgi:hypothetical protein